MWPWRQAGPHWTVYVSVAYVPRIQADEGVHHSWWVAVIGPRLSGPLAVEFCGVGAGAAVAFEAVDGCQFVR